VQGNAFDRKRLAQQPRRGRGFASAVGPGDNDDFGHQRARGRTSSVAGLRGQLEIILKNLP